MSNGNPNLEHEIMRTHDASVVELIMPLHLLGQPARFWRGKREDLSMAAIGLWMVTAVCSFAAIAFCFVAVWRNDDLIFPIDAAFGLTFVGSGMVYSRYSRKIEKLIAADFAPGTCERSYVWCYFYAAFGALIGSYLWSAVAVAGRGA